MTDEVGTEERIKEAQEKVAKAIKAQHPFLGKQVKVLKRTGGADSGRFDGLLEGFVVVIGEEADIMIHITNVESIRIEKV